MATTTAPDPDLLRRLLAEIALGNAHSLQQLYRTASPKLFGFALRILNRNELAEEALQECFVSIWHSAGTYQPHLSAPMTWMATIARNKALDLLRRHQPEEVEAGQFDGELLEGVEDEAHGPLGAAEMDSDARALADCMAHLDKTHRQALGMAYYHDLSHSEVAQRLALPIGTVKTWIRRSLEKLRACLTGKEAA